MKNVRIIPEVSKENKKLRVVTYCRVSKFGPEQLRSIDIQIKTYTKMIRNYPNWIFAGVFFDVESGLRRNVRDGLDKMLRKAAKGKIDYIWTNKVFPESQGIKTVTGKEVWDTKTIQKMLKNEKYKGDTMLQKTFTEDFMIGKKSKNIGQR